MEPLRADEFTEGLRYRVRFRLSNQRRAREFVGTYMGCEGTRLWWDLRPGAGTTQLDASDIMAAMVVPRSVPHSNPKVVKADGGTDE